MPDIPANAFQYSSTNPNLTHSLGSVVREVSTAAPDKDEPALFVSTARCGDASAVWPEYSDLQQAAHLVSTAGTSQHKERSVLVARAEAMERYCAGFGREGVHTIASARTLGDRALDLRHVARCSERELAHPKNVLHIPRLDDTMRWVAGLNLVSGETVYIPSVMAYSPCRWRYEGERFWLPISTGCAAHETYAKALFGGICEVIERDALTLTWLLKLALREVIVDLPEAELDAHWQKYQAAGKHLLFRFFDATTDMGVPVIYGVSYTPSDPKRTVLVACSCASTFDRAIAKVIADLTAMRRAFRPVLELPEDFSDFTDLRHGATYMGRAEQAQAFAFLLEASSIVTLSSLRARQKPVQSLPELIDLLNRRGVAIYAVDLTTDEAVRAGLRVVRAVLPQLQPLSFRYTARFLGHPRLYTCTWNESARDVSEDQINAFPQPFA